jgi:hypothetical protein
MKLSQQLPLYTLLQEKKLQAKEDQKLVFLFEVEFGLISQ